MRPVTASASASASALACSRTRLLRQPHIRNLSTRTLTARHSSSTLLSRFNCLSLVQRTSPAYQTPSYSKHYSTAVAEELPRAQHSSLVDVARIRNIAIIAHVDHGKTTLVDALLRQSGAALGNEGARLMDSNVLEKERGITILSKATSITYKDHRINIVDTPGHADFGGEVERVLAMVDGVILVVDATEGPMTQTKYVLEKALKRGLRPVVVLNKADRPTQRADAVDSELFDLFSNLDANDIQMDYPIIYASAKEGWATLDLQEGKRETMQPLFDAILEHVTPPSGDRTAPFSMLVTQIESNNFFGQCYLGRITSGVIRINYTINAVDTSGKITDNNKITKILLRSGMESHPVETAGAGDIVTIAGISNATVNHTICHPSVVTPLPSDPIDPPTVSMILGPNDSPLAGQEGTYLTSAHIRERLAKEAETNIALQLLPVPDRKEYTEVRGRGELQLGILIETMRREGFELTVSPPRVVYQNKEEPIELLEIDLKQEHTGGVISALALRKAEMKDMIENDDGSTRLVFEAPTRGLIGYLSEFKNYTRGEGVMNRAFLRYEPYRGTVDRGRKPVLVSQSQGVATAYALNAIESRGRLFIVPGAKVYPGMAIGEYCKDGADLEVNPVKTKALTNIRAAGKDEAVRLTPIRPMSLEETIAYVQPDEAIEVTPKSIRIRKAELDPTKRKIERRMKDSDKP